ncbi:MAG: cytochrome c biogenesis protein CcmG/thiol:disulfide interchange protein DsbE [Maribacter sp.]|jgi:cytochrome c biogenesis protein CcmG/thiol:disulfide interchange protein DsbE
MKLIKTFVIFLFVSAIAVSTSAQKIVPEIDVKTLQGQSVNIQDYTNKGQITVLSFWATWCAPCKKELNAISDVYEQWQEDYDVQLVAVTIDDSRALRKVKPMVDGFSWDYIVLSDANEDLKKALNFQTVPQTFLIDQEGNIVYSHSGYSPGDENELEEKIAELATPAVEEVEAPTELDASGKKGKKKKKRNKKGE